MVAKLTLIRRGESPLSRAYSVSGELVSSVEVGQPIQILLLDQTARTVSTPIVKELNRTATGYYATAMNSIYRVEIL